jgi:hypothetical protein
MRPVFSVITFLSLPFLSKHRNAFVVRIIPRTLVAKEVLRLTIKTSGKGLKDSMSEEKPNCMSEVPTYKSIRV